MTVEAPALAAVWKQRVRVHIEARTGAMRVELSMYQIFLPPLVLKRATQATAHRSVPVTDRKDRLVKKLEGQNGLRRRMQIWVLWATLAEVRCIRLLHGRI